MPDGQPPAPPQPPNDPAPAGGGSELQRRRALEDAILALGQTTSEFALRAASEQIAADWPAPMILPVLAKYLDTPSSQLRGGLARLAAVLPHEETAALLRRHAANRGGAPQARMTAAMILERFLGDPLSPGLLGDLQASNDAALQSLREAVEEGRRNRHVLLEYVTQMQQHGEEIAFLVMHHLDAFAVADRVELLRLLAQEPRPRVANAALTRLEIAAAEDARALRALYTLQWTLPPAQAQPLERALRKLQFRGKLHTPPAAGAWRALLSPAEAAGQIWLWLLRMPAAGESGLLAGLLLHPAAGVLYTTVADPVEPSWLPAPAPLGALVDMPLEALARGRFVEAPFDLGRALLRLALRAHWAGSARHALEGELLLANDRIWDAAPPSLEPALAALLEQPDAPVAPGGSAESAELTALLLREPVMAGWTLHANLRGMGAGMPAALGVEAAALARLLVREVEQAPARDEMMQGIATGLWMQALWLHAAGRANAAQAAWRLSAATRVLPPTQNPLLLALVTAALQQPRPRRSRPAEQPDAE